MSNKEKIEGLKNEIKGLKEKIKTLREESNDNTLTKMSADLLLPAGQKHKMKRTLKGHLAKIYACAWAHQDGVHLVSASQDGKLLVWDALTTNKTHAIHLRSNCMYSKFHLFSFTSGHILFVLIFLGVMACDYSPESGWVASGGLDNICSIFSLKPEANKEGGIKCSRELMAHQGYLSCCKFLSESQILTGSGDWSCILWDISGNVKIQEFQDHTQDVITLAVTGDKKNFVSAGTFFIVIVILFTANSQVLFILIIKLYFIILYLLISN